MPTISISQEIYDELKIHSRSWEDTPTKIIKRLLDKSNSGENVNVDDVFNKMEGPVESRNEEKEILKKFFSEKPGEGYDKIKNVLYSTNPDTSLRDKTTPVPIIRKIVMLLLGEEGSGYVSPEAVVSGTTKIMEFNNLLTGADLDTIPSGKTRLESKIERLQGRLIDEGLLDHAEGYWQLTEEGKKECEEDMKNSRLPTIRGDKANDPGIPKVTYRHTRLCFFKEIIEGLDADESFRILCNDGIFQMTKNEFHEVFDNVIATRSYKERGHYHSPKPPRKAMRFKIL